MRAEVLSGAVTPDYSGCRKLELNSPLFPDPDVHLLVLDIDREADAIRRQPWIDDESFEADLLRYRAELARNRIALLARFDQILDEETVCN